MRIPLHAYQEPAVDRFIERRRFLLAFDMGLGKTVVSIAAIEELLGMGEITQALIVCPASLKWQWAAKIAEVTDVGSYEIQIGENRLVIPDPTYCVVVDGGPKDRQQAYDDIEQIRPPYVIVGYETLVTDRQMYTRFEHQVIVADEITKIKNPAARVTKAMRRLDAPYKLGLTGTPVDRKLEDLYQIFKWIDPDLLGSERAFDRAYLIRDYWGNVKGYKNTAVLHKKVAPAMMRLRADDPAVAAVMPTVEHDRWTVTMDEPTRAVYRRIMADLAVELEQLPAREQFDVDAHYSGKSEDTPAGRVMAVHLAAQMLLTHPPMLYDSPSRYARQLVESGLLDELGESAKLARLHAELTWILAEDPKAKVVVVTRFRGLLSHLAEEYGHLGIVTYHGGMSAVSKQAAVNLFHSDDDMRLFLMSHAGAYGVDIPAASWLINIDPPRSAGQRAQINARHVRASSRHRVVKVRDLVTAGTIEERTYDRLGVRRRVASAVVDGEDSGPITEDVASLTAHVRAILER